MIRAALFMICASLWAHPGAAQDFRALARVLPEGTALRDAGGGVELTLAISQSVPFRIRTHDGPPRLVIEFRELVLSSLPPGFDAADGVVDLSTGAAARSPGWSRMVLELAGPMAVETAHMQTDEETGAARITVTLSPVSPEVFAASAEPTLLPPAPAGPRPGDDGRLVVALDPGHGGIDPGAEAGGLREADLMLVFARELAELLLRSGEVDVVLTREADVFVSLPGRITRAREAGADVFISLHADALAEGRATGATVYTLSDEASDAASAALAERFDRADLLQGADLSATDDQVASVLIDLARRDTGPRSDALAEQIVQAIGAADVALHRHPRLQAGFTVLKAADIPSVLVEIGFLSDDRDLERIQDPEWRARMQAALAFAIIAWATDDAALSGLRFQ